MKKRLNTAFMVFMMFSSLVFSQNANSQTSKVFSVDLFEQGNKTILGQNYSLPNDNPYFVMRDVEMPIGYKTDIHQHSQPLYILVSGGELEIDYGSKGKKVFHAGQAYVEAINWCHQGQSVGNVPLKMLAIYVADNSQKELIKPSTCQTFN